MAEASAVGVTMTFMTSLVGVFLLTETRRYFGWIAWKWHGIYDHEMPGSIKTMMKWPLLMFGLVGLGGFVVGGYQHALAAYGHDEAVRRLLPGALVLVTGVVVLLQRRLYLDLYNAMRAAKAPPAKVLALATRAGWSIVLSGHVLVLSFVL